MTQAKIKLPPYRQSIAGTLLAAREAVMAPIRPVLRSADVTEQQWRVLRVLNDQGSIDPTGLAEAALLFPPSVSRILKDLLDRRLIERKSDANDRRRYIVLLSPEGARVMQGIAAETAKTLANYRRRFGARRLDQLLAELRVFTETIAESGPESAPDEA